VMWAFSEHVSASLTVVGGWIGNGAALGLMLGVSPQVRAWR
jgi:phosphate/sulfate permease